MWCIRTKISLVQLTYGGDNIKSPLLSSEKYRKLTINSLNLYTTLYIVCSLLNEPMRSAIQWKRTSNRPGLCNQQYYGKLHLVLHHKLEINTTWHFIKWPCRKHSCLTILYHINMTQQDIKKGFLSNTNQIQFSSYNNCSDWINLGWIIHSLE